MTGALMNLQADKPLSLNSFQMPTEWYGGCHGPLVYGPCNKLLWNQRSSKTRVGVPCFGCTRPDFPQSYPFFETRNIEGVPLELPDGIDRAHYMAYKGLAAAAAPQRLKRRETKV